MKSCKPLEDCVLKVEVGFFFSNWNLIAQTEFHDRQIFPGSLKQTILEKENIHVGRGS